MHTFNWDVYTTPHVHQGSAALAMLVFMILLFYVSLVISQGTMKTNKRCYLYISGWPDPIFFMWPGVVRS